jgi:hypothetical protein
MSSTLITDYLHVGTHASRPESPPMPSGGAALYYETDTLHLFLWNGSAWVEPPVMTGDSGSGGAIGYVPAPGAGDADAGKFLKADGTFQPPLGGVDSRTTVTETIDLASRGKLVTFNNAGAIAVTLDSTVPANFFCAVKNIGAGPPTLTPSSGNIDGGASVTLGSPPGAWLWFDGTDWWTL